MTRTKSIYMALLAVLLSPMAANADPVSSIGPFAGDLAEDWESFDNYLEGDFYEPEPIAIMGGNAALTSSSGEVVIYEPDAGAIFGLGPRGLAEVSDGTKGAGLNNFDMVADILFDDLISEFGAYWNNPPGYDIFISFFGLGDALIDAFAFTATGDTGALEWFGWSSTIGISRIQISGSFFVFDGLQANTASAPVPEPGTLALLSLGLLGLGLSRRKKA